MILLFDNICNTVSSIRILQTAGVPVGKLREMIAKKWKIFEKNLHTAHVTITAPHLTGSLKDVQKPRFSCFYTDKSSILSQNDEGEATAFHEPAPYWGTWEHFNDTHNTIGKGQELPYKRNFGRREGIEKLRLGCGDWRLG